MLSFAIWGMGDIFSGGFFGNTVAEVGPVKIGAQQVGNEYQRELNRLRSMNVNAEQARQMGLLDRVVQNMVSRASFDAEALEQGLTASDETIVEEIRSNPAFRGNLGSFDRILFEQIIRTYGLTEEMYVAELRQDIARDQALDSIATSIKVPKSIADLIYGYREERRVAAVTEVPIDAFVSVSEPTPTDLIEFHKANEPEFTAPERRAVAYIHLSPDDFAKRIVVSQDDLVAAFEDRAEEFGLPETRKTMQMVVSEEEQAKTAFERLAAGQEFAAVASEVAGQTSKSIDLGEISKQDLPEDLSFAVFELAADQVSKPIKGPFGWHIFKVEKINAGRKAMLDDVRERLNMELAREKAVDDVYKAANNLEDAIGAGANFESAAAKLGLELKSVPAIDARGHDAEEKTIEGLPANPFVETVFTSGIDEPGVLTESEDGGFFILRVKSVTPSALKPLEDVKKQVAEAWKRQKRAELSEARAKDVASAIESGRELKDIAEAPSKEATVTEPFTRGTGVAQTRLPFSVVSDLFEFKTAGKVAVGRSGNGYIVAKLEEIQPAESLKDVDGYRGLAQNLRAKISGDLLYQYNQALRDRHGASVNNALVEQLFTDNNQFGGHR